MLLKRAYTLKNKIQSKEKEKECEKEKEKENEKVDTQSTKKEKKVRGENPPPKKLSNYIKTEENIKFIIKNKSALKEYEIFLNRFKKKKNQFTFGSINNNYQYQNKMSIFKDNPRLIISSYKTNFMENTKNRIVKHNNNILGVDEGLIVLPKINLEEEQNNYIINDKIFNTNENVNKNNMDINNSNNNMSNIYVNTEININNRNDNYNNNNVNLKNRRINSVNKKKKIITSYLDRGEERISKLSKNRNKKDIYKNYNYKNNNKTVDNSNRFRYEIRRLNKWDFNHLLKERGSETDRIDSNRKIENILSEIKQSQQMNWLTEIKNNKEQFKLMCRNKHLKDFINKINEDQNAIYMKNIKVLKKDFNFNIFSGDSENENNLNEEKKYSENKSDTYNQIIREKIKLEENLSHEVSISAEVVYNFKKKIQDERILLNKLNNHLNKLKKNQEKLIIDYDENIKRLDLLLQQLDNTIMQKNENKNTNENKNKNTTIKNTENNIKINPRTNTRNVSLNMGNLKSKRLSIINSLELTKVRTLLINNNNITNNNNRSERRFSTINNIFLNNNNVNNINNGNKNDELIEAKDEELIIKNNLLLEKTNLDKEHKRELLKIKNERNEIKNKMKKIDEKVHKLAEELSKAKNNFNEHIQSLSDYYYQILKKGIDVRRNGLSWVIVKLMELNAFIDYTHFPTFLDTRQINYLMRIGAKIYEVKELIKLFQLFKKKEKNIKDGYINEDRNKEKEEKIEKLIEIKKLNKNKIGNNYVEYLEGIQQKYDSSVNFNIDEEIEEKNINKTSKYLKDIILHDYDKNVQIYYIPGSLGEYFSKDEKFREYFDDVYYLNEEINKRQRQIKKEKEDELKYYRNKFKIHKLDGKNWEENIKHINTFIKPDKDRKQNKNDDDLFESVNEDNSQNIRRMIFAALFGNGTPL